MKNVIKISTLCALIVFCGCGRTQAKAAKVSGPVIAPENIPTQRVYFPFASDAVLSDAAAEIDDNIRWMNKNLDAYIILEGHCDKVGQTEYNVELGDRRARAVKAYMMEKGISSERIIMVVSYGSARPLNMGSRVEDLRENRRVEFVLR